MVECWGSNCVQTFFEIFMRRWKTNWKMKIFWFENPLKDIWRKMTCKRVVWEVLKKQCRENTSKLRKREKILYAIQFPLPTADQDRREAHEDNKPANQPSFGPSDRAWPKSVQGSAHQSIKNQHRNYTNLPTPKWAPSVMRAHGDAGSVTLNSSEVPQSLCAKGRLCDFHGGHAQRLLPRTPPWPERQTNERYQTCSTCTFPR